MKYQAIDRAYKLKQRVEHDSEMLKRIDTALEKTEATKHPATIEMRPRASTQSKFVIIDGKDLQIDVYDFLKDALHNRIKKNLKEIEEL